MAWYGCYGVDDNTNGYPVGYVREASQPPVEAVTRACANEVTAMLRVGDWMAANGKQNGKSEPDDNREISLSEYTDEDLRDGLYMLDCEGDEADDIILELARRITAVRGQS